MNTPMKLSSLTTEQKTRLLDELAKYECDNWFQYNTIIPLIQKLDDRTRLKMGVLIQGQELHNENFGTTNFPTSKRKTQNEDFAKHRARANRCKLILTTTKTKNDTRPITRKSAAGRQG